MKNDNADITIIGTNSNPDCVYKMVCDEFYKEPSFKSTDEYLKYCLSFCQEHSVDVFVPRHNLTQIIKHKSEFEEIGTKLLANTDYESVIITDDKIKTYQHLILIFNQHIDKIQSLPVMLLMVSLDNEQIVSQSLSTTF